MAFLAKNSPERTTVVARLLVLEFLKTENIYMLFYRLPPLYC